MLIALPGSQAYTWSVILFIEELSFVRIDCILQITHDPASVELPPCAVSLRDYEPFWQMDEARASCMHVVRMYVVLLAPTIVH